jgi:hypothetical protein
MKQLNTMIIAVVAGAIMATNANAGEADVVDVKISQTSAGSYSFDVAVKHADTGWEHYADSWKVLDNQGNILGKRVLVHPHVDEQPFTRSLSGVKISAELTSVTIRAHDSVHKYGGKEITVKVPR